MNFRPYKINSYHKKATKDLSNLKQIVNPELKKRNDETFKILVDNLNRNTSLNSYCYEYKQCY